MMRRFATAAPFIAVEDRLVAGAVPGARLAEERARNGNAAAPTAAVARAKSRRLTFFPMVPSNAVIIPPLL